MKSSFNKLEIEIINPVLLEILQKYKDIGLFGDHESFFGIGEYTSTNALWVNYPYYQENTNPPAFYYFEDEQDGVNGLNLYYSAPKLLSEVLNSIIEMMDTGKEYLDEKILSLLKEELRKREAEINHAYISVEWLNEQLWDGGYPYYKFYYSPGVGEKYSEGDIWEEQGDEDEEEEKVD